MRLTRSRKILATGAALLGIMLGAAGIAAAATGSGRVAHRVPAVRSQQSADPKDASEPNDTSEANDGPDANDNQEHEKSDGAEREKSDGAEHEDGGVDAGEVESQG